MLPFLKERLSTSKTLAQSKSPIFQTLPDFVLLDINVLLVISKVSEIAEVSEILVFKLSIQISVSSHLPSKFGQFVFFLHEEKTHNKPSNKTQNILMFKCKKNIEIKYKKGSF